MLSQQYRLMLCFYEILVRALIERRSYTGWRYHWFTTVWRWVLASWRVTDTSTSFSVVWPRYPHTWSSSSCFRSKLLCCRRLSFNVNFHKISRCGPSAPETRLLFIYLFASGRKGSNTVKIVPHPLALKRLKWLYLQLFIQTPKL